MKKTLIIDPLSLDNFRNELVEEVLEWGFIYFNNRWVKEPTEIMPGLFAAVVNEPNPQEVTYRESELGLADIFCTCGDAKHKYCRHMAAVLFFLESKRS